MFGTRRIFAKISNNKLIVRVGGGFTSIDEFITQYGEGELQKIKLMNPEKLAELHTPNAKDARNGVIEMSTAKRWLAGSPRGPAGQGSPRRNNLAKSGSRVGIVWT